MRRMDRYNDTDTIKEKRLDKNKDLYHNIADKYTNITDVTNANVYEINNEKTEGKSREKYQQLKKYQQVEDVPKSKKELDDFNYLYQKNTHKVYDINSVIEEARKNKQTDKDDEKRKLKHTSYNILSGVNLEELLKYREEKKNREITEEEMEIRELVDTIASKTLAGEIDKETTVDLLSDLMATNMLDKVSAADEIDDTSEVTADLSESIDEEITDDVPSLTGKIETDKIRELEEKPEEINDKLKNADKDFYTRSMDLSEEDFDMDQEFADKKLPGIVKFILFILILAIILLAAYYIKIKLGY